MNLPSLVEETGDWKKVRHDFYSNKVSYSQKFNIEKGASNFQKTACTFRAVGEPELWIGATGETRKIKNYSVENGFTTIPMEFFPYESFFVTFSGENVKPNSNQNRSNFPVFKELMTLEGAWEVSFNEKFGGPKKITFEKLQDWKNHELRGIKYYSGIATCQKTFNINRLEDNTYFIDLGEVHDIARVKLNGKEIGIIWCAPWRIDVSGALKEGENKLELEVANRWINRLLGDRQEPDANVRTVKFKNGLMGGKEYITGRYTFTTEAAMRSFKFEEPLSSGLLGPVAIQKVLQE